MIEPLALLDGGTATKLLDSLAVTLMLFVVFMALFNKGDKNVVVLSAQDEHVVMAIGGGVLAAGMIFGKLWLAAAGALIFFYGSYARFTDNADLENVV